MLLLVTPLPQGRNCNLKLKVQNFEVLTVDSFSDLVVICAATFLRKQSSTHTRSLGRVLFSTLKLAEVESARSGYKTTNVLGKIWQATALNRKSNWWLGCRDKCSWLWGTSGPEASAAAEILANLRQLQMFDLRSFSSLSLSLSTPPEGSRSGTG